MSWSVSATGRAEDVAKEIERQFELYLAESPAGLSDDGEKATVRLTSDMIARCLLSFDPDRKVAVSASGHMGFADYSDKTGAYQGMSVRIAP